MKISFANNREEQIHTGMGFEKDAKLVGKQLKGNGIGAYFEKGVDSSGTVGTLLDDEKDKPFTQMLKQAQLLDVSQIQDYMTVVSHTMSDEDYAKMCEEGFSFEQLKPEDAKTILDTIKIELLRAGKQIAGFTDDLNVDMVARAVGSETLARNLTDAFQANDIPLTEENLNQVQNAYNMAATLLPPNDEASCYMVMHHMEPEIENLYLAQNVAPKNTQNMPTGYYREEISGYLSQSSAAAASQLDQQEIELRLQQLLPDRTVTQPDREDALFLVDHKLPLTRENLLLYQNIRSVQFPVTDEVFARSVSCALAEGKPAMAADLSQTENKYEKADALFTRYEAFYQIQQKMCAEVNVKLLESGFSLDTATPDEMLKELERIRENVAMQYFPEQPVEKALESFGQYTEANTVFRDMGQLPAAGLRLLVNGNEPEMSVHSFYEGAKTIQAGFIRNLEAYEALRTDVRRDLGDRLSKAFEHIDGILRDIGLEDTKENQRAVRILAYNQMEITQKSVEEVTRADRQVNRVIEKMTPAAVLKMIRDGVNPLEKTFSQINEYLDSQPTTYEEEAQGYAKYLYGLDRQGEITEDQRESFIGIFRMLRQIEKSDGKAIGSILSTNAVLDFKNILHALQSGKMAGMDIRINDEFGFLTEMQTDEKTTLSQISRAYTELGREVIEAVSENEKTISGYAKQQAELVRQQLQAANEAGEQILERAQMPVTCENLCAAGELFEDGKPIAKRESAYFNQTKTFLTQKLLSKDLTEILDHESFEEEYTQTLEDSLQELEEETFQKDSTLDVAAMQLAHKQLYILKGLSDVQEYDLPAYVGGELTNMHVTLQKNSEERNNLRICLSHPKGERIEADLQVTAEKITGILATNRAEKVMLLKESSDIFNKYLREEGYFSTDAQLVVMEGIGQNVSAPETTHTKTTDSRQLLSIAKLFLSAVKEVNYGGVNEN